jgi:hypothetical protein
MISSVISFRTLKKQSFQKGQAPLRDKGAFEVYNYAVFWTRIINETDNPLELKIEFQSIHMRFRLYLANTLKYWFLPIQ